MASISNTFHQSCWQSPCGHRGRLGKEHTAPGVLVEQLLREVGGALGGTSPLPADPRPVPPPWATPLPAVTGNGRNWRVWYPDFDSARVSECGFCVSVRGPYTTPISFNISQVPRAVLMPVLSAPRRQLRLLRRSGRGTAISGRQGGQVQVRTAVPAVAELNLKAL